MARYLRDQLRRDPCPCCKGIGYIEIDGDEAPCPVESCLASELLVRDYVSERIYSPAYHREQLGLTEVLPGRVDPAPPYGRGVVVNIHHYRAGEWASDRWDVLIGRGSLYGNPFSHLKNTRAAVQVDTREEAIEAFRLWMTSDLEIPGWQKPTRRQVIALRGKRLGCYCAPKACHGDVLLELAELWSA
jgi:hypothetical protein